MPGLKDFTTQAFHYRSIITKAAAYSVLLTDECIQVNGAYTMTLPVLSTMQGSTTHKKVYKFVNIHATADATIAAGTGNTIGSRASFTLKPNESIVIVGSEAGTDWMIGSPFPTPALIRVPFTVVATTSGTGAVNVFDANGAPTAIDITAIVTIAQDTNAGNIAVTNGTNTVATIAKSTTAALLVGDTGLTYAAVVSGDTLTVASSTTNGNAKVIITGTMQQYV